MRALLITLWAICTCLTLTQSVTRYDNYHLIEFTPKDATQRLDFLQLPLLNSEYIFLRTSKQPGVPWLVVVHPNRLLAFGSLLQNVLSHRTLNTNLQAAMDKERQQTLAATGFDFSAYHTLDTIYAWLDEVETKQYVTGFQAGTTYEHQPIRGVKIARGSQWRAESPGVFVECGIHAREWITPAFCAWLINELLTSTDAAIVKMANEHDFWIMPVVNPDGYRYSHEHDRLWRKTRKPSFSVLGIDLCTGTDPNRNWKSHWNEQGTSPIPCAENYAGSAAFSEIEMDTLSNFLDNYKSKIQTYISIHSYSQLLMFPYGWTTNPASNENDLKQIGDAAAAALAVRYQTQYTVGSIYDTVYPASGTSVDYVYDELGVKLAYTYELRPSAKDTDVGFELPADQIIPVCLETVDSLVALLAKAKELGYNLMPA